LLWGTIANFPVTCAFPPLRAMKFASRDLAM
jgi:hypothetical protein